MKGQAGTDSWKMTTQPDQVGVGFLDHPIIGEAASFSFKADGLL
jgi:hypothetical protein